MNHGKSAIKDYEYSEDSVTDAFKKQPKLTFIRRTILLRYHSQAITMADNLHAAIKALSIEDDKPLVLPDSPRFRVFDKNATSILGRLLNPDCQQMSKMIETMPKVWRMQGRVRGIALSKNKFQFVFQREEDLQTVLADRPWTYDHWTMLMERWIPSPPADFLTSFDVWVRIRNIPMNHYTIETMNVLGKAVGRVVEIAYDPKESQKTDYVRVKINLNVANPARVAKNLTIPTGETVAILYEYEKLRKRCFFCQRLTHEQALCQWMKKAKENLGEIHKEALVREDTVSGNPTSLNRVAGQQALEGPPGFPALFPGLSKEDNRMALQYISHADPTERQARIMRVQQSMEEATGESNVQPIRITTEVDKGKGHVFSYEENNLRSGRTTRREIQPAVSAPLQPLNNLYDVEISSAQSWDPNKIARNQIVFSAQALTEAEAEGSSASGKKERKRPPAWKRHTRQTVGVTSQGGRPKTNVKGKEGSKRKVESVVMVPKNKSPRVLENTVASALKPLPSQ